MNIRKNLALVVSAAIATPLIIAALVFLGIFAARYGKVRSELSATEKRLQELNRRKPFPSEENIRLLEKNRDVMDAAFRRAMEDLARGQYEPPALEPARFSQELREMNRRLTRIAQAHNVARPPQFGYGFDRYFKGDLPARGDMPRLLTQVNAVESVCQALFEAGIAEITKVERQVFEEQNVAGTGGPAEFAGVAVRMPVVAESASAGGGSLPAQQSADPGGLFTWERVVVEFTTRELGLWNALNALQRSPTFIVVSSLSIINETAKPQIAIEDEAERAGKTASSASRPGAPTALPPGSEMIPGAAAPGAPAAAPARPPSREERIVTGRDELLKVRLEAEVYRFQPPAAADR